MNLNKAFVLGRLTQDPQIKSLPSGDLVASFSVATNRVFYNKNREKQEQAEFHNVVTFGKLAEISQQYLKQGSMVLIEGRLQTRSWEDKEGIKKYRTEIIAQSLQLGPKPAGTPSNFTPSSQPKENSSKKMPESTEEEIPTVEEEEIDVKDLPL